MLKLLNFLLFLLLATSSTSQPTDALTLQEPLKSRCSNRPVFILPDISYSSSLIYSTPAHLAVAEGNISFNLTNTAVPYKTQCSAHSNREFDFFYGDMVYYCDAPSGEGAGKGASANFTFSQLDGTFNVNQTWDCKADRAHKTEKLLGFGSGKATLNCETEFWTNPNWTIGQIYSTTTTTCKPAVLKITPKVVVTH